MGAVRWSDAALQSLWVQEISVCTSWTVNIAMELATATNVTYVFGDNIVHRARRAK